MLLTITTTHQPATDLGYLLHKNPSRFQTFSLSAGQAHVFYPVAETDHCTACLLLDVDPIALVRGKPGSRTLDQYVNDRPYASSSLLSVALAQVYGSALSGQCRDRPELVKTPIPLTAQIPSLNCHGGEAMIRRLFEPLGYQIQVTTHPLSLNHPDWGNSPVHSLEISQTVTLHELLNHLYVLIPVMDNDKHYWVGDDEVTKLLRHGEGWLTNHPHRDLIFRRYLRNIRGLIDDAVRQLRLQDGNDTAHDTDSEGEDPGIATGQPDPWISLHNRRHDAIVELLASRKVSTVADLGCGEGKLLRKLQKKKGFQRIIGLEICHRTLEIAAARLKLQPGIRTQQPQNIELIHGSLLYHDPRLAGLDAVVLCEVIEHMDPARLRAMERVVFEDARPKLALITTPNREYNVIWDKENTGALRHQDHRFEWTRGEFAQWCDRIQSEYGYQVQIQGIGDPETGPDGQDVGSPTQMAVLTLGD